VSTEQFSRFVAVLSLVAWAGTLVGLVALAGRRRWPWAARLVGELGGVVLWLAALVAVVCTAGSLYYSEVAHFVPCELCWFQRICMYPLSATLLIAAALGDRRAWRYVVVPAVVGTVIAAYHTQLQAFPEQSTFCPTTVPCNIRHVWEFGFVSLPFMSLAGFVAILVAIRIAAVGGTPGPAPQEVPS
jgi:disulfide bond formation protein DsbB